MGENPKFERPTTPEEEHELTLERSKYMLGHIAEQDKQIARHGIEPLTGAQRREVLVRELDQALKMIRGKIGEQREGKEPLREAALVFIDLDKFKQVNDIHGHPTGDKVLQKVTGLLKGVLREKDLLARYGGDEFAVFMPNTDESGAATAAEKLRAALDTDPELKGFGVTASIGVCSSNVSTAEDSENFIKHADEAAYVAKRAGGNRVEVYT